MRTRHGNKRRPSVAPATRGRGRGRGRVTRGGRPIGSSVLMEAPHDPALCHVGGAEIQHNTEDDHENPLPLTQETQQDNNLTPPTRSDSPALTWHGPDNHLFRSNSPSHDPFFDNNNAWSFEEEQAIQVSTAPPLTQGAAVSGPVVRPTDETRARCFTNGYLRIQHDHRQCNGIEMISS